MGNIPGNDHIGARQVVEGDTVDGGGPKSVVIYHFPKIVAMLQNIIVWRLRHAGGIILLNAFIYQEKPTFFKRYPNFVL